MVQKPVPLHVTCYNGCKRTHTFHIPPGKPPRGMRWLCDKCQKKGAGLGHAAYPDHGTNAD